MAKQTVEILCFTQDITLVETQELYIQLITVYLYCGGSI